MNSVPFFLLYADIEFSDAKTILIKMIEGVILENFTCPLNSLSVNCIKNFVLHNNSLINLHKFQFNFYYRRPLP